MRSLKEHPFFKALDYADFILKKTKQFGGGPMNATDRRLFYKVLKNAHPFVFDKKVTFEKRHMGRACADVGELVQDFTLPFAISLYLMTDAPEILAPMGTSDATEKVLTKALGYLVYENEHNPEEYIVWAVHNAQLVEHIDKEANMIPVPCINMFNISLKTIQTAMRLADAVGEEVFSRRTEAHVLKETSVILQFTNAVSVKRVGVEVSRQFNMKTRGMNAGFTSLKYDNIVHIADKEEYEYVKPLDDSTINWEYCGHWRGHWRAFYVADLKDQFGRNVVDYGRIGKNRAGEYIIPGYTWVKEHTKGDPALAEIKTRMVKHE